MTDPRDEREPTGLTDLPLQPTGSGVADAEIARMQDRLTGDGFDGSPGTATDDEADRPSDASGDGDAF